MQRRSGSGNRDDEEPLLGRDLLLEGIQDAVFSVGLDGRLRLWSSAAMALYGYSKDEARGRPVERLFHAAELERLREELIPGVLREGFYQTEIRQLHASGDEIVVSLRMRRLEGADGISFGWFGCARDITAEQRAGESAFVSRERLGEISAKLVGAQEAERRRIARELHDDLGQRLAALAFGLGVSRMDLDQETPKEAGSLSSNLEQLQNHAKDLVDDLRRLSHELHPSSFQRHTLTALLKAYCAEFSSRLNLDIELTLDDVDADWLPGLRLSLFRIVQEGLRNVVEHAGVGTASVSLSRQGDFLRLAIEDAGSGFDSAESGSGLGLVSMAERARLQGANLEVHSWPGVGTCIEVRVPLEEAEADDEGRVDLGSGSAERRIGPYLLLKRLGQGGMGVVYLAEQREPVPRRVALKLLRAPLPGGKELLRFDAERRALGRMEHPNIARIYGAEVTEEGDPFLVMEYVDGLNIVAYADHRRLSVEQRLELFIATCRGVEHAHQKRVIHRDLKPSNVLVAELGGESIPKLIDFGIAKAMDHPLTAGTVAPAETNLIGTLAYASPEALRGNEVDIRSDIYSLGALLYELLVGEAPHIVDRATPAESLKRLIDRGGLQAPSECWHSLDSAVVGERATQRQAEVAAVGRRLRGDLDHIVMKALAEEPGHRYASAGELVADLRRYLRHEKVEASPPSQLDELKKFLRRHRAGVMAAVLAVLVMVGSLAATLRESHRANREAVTATQIASFLEMLFEAADPGREARVTVLDLLAQGAVRIRGDLAGQPRAQARLMNTLGRIYGRLGVLDEASRLLEESLEIRSGLTGGELEVAENLYDLAQIFRQTMRYEEAAVHLDRALDLRKEILGRDHPDVALLFHEMATVLLMQGRASEAQAVAQRALQISEGALGRFHPQIGIILETLGLAAAGLEDYSRAEALLRRALEIHRATPGSNRIELAEVLTALASVYRLQGRYGEAVPLFREALEIAEEWLSPEHPTTVSILNNVALLYRSLGQLQRAEAAYRRVVEIEERAGGNDRALMIGLVNLSVVHRMRGQLESAEFLLQRVLEVAERSLGLESHPAAAAYRQLGFIAQDRKDLALSESLIRRALRIHERVDGPANISTVLTEVDLARVYCEKEGQQERAAPILERVVEFLEERIRREPANSLDRRRLAETLLVLGQMYRARGEWGSARNTWSRAAELAAPLTRESPAIYPVLTLVRALFYLERNEEAKPLAESLLAKGVRVPDFVELCRSAGWAVEE